MIELQDKRTYNAKTFDNGDGTVTLHAHVGHIHYKENNVFLESDFTPEDKGTYWEMAKHNYRLRVAKNFAAPLLIQYTNVYEGANHSITYEPQSIAWYNHQTDDVQVFRNQQSVQGVWNSEKNSFYYTNAFGNGIDFEITIQRSGFKKEVVIPKKPAVFPTAPGTNYKLVALFKYGGSGLRVLKDTGGEWDNNTFLDHNGGFELPETANPLAKSFIRPAYAVDSDNRQVPLRVAWVKRNNKLWQVKEIPLGLFEQATFPVRFDTTTSYYSGAGDGEVRYEGSGATWDTVHDAATGTAAYATSTRAIVGSYLYSGGGYIIYRSFLPFDTSGIGSGQTISSATLKIRPSDKWNADNDGDDFIAVVQTTQASTTTLATADYDTCGNAIDNPTKGSADHDMTSIGTSAYYSIDLNSTGLDWIVPTGTTKIGLREGHDMKDVAVTGSAGDTAIRFYCSEQTGTSTDPYLEVTYTAAASTFTPRVMVY